MGNESVFSQFFEAFPNAIHRINTRIDQDLDLLGLSDVLIGGSSSFTSLAAALNLKGINVVPYGNPKFWGILNRVSVEELAAASRNESNPDKVTSSGDNPLTGAQGMVSFNKFVCEKHAQLYLSKDFAKKIRNNCKNVLLTT